MGQRGYGRWYERSLGLLLVGLIGWGNVQPGGAQSMKQPGDKARQGQNSAGSLDVLNDEGMRLFRLGDQTSLKQALTLFAELIRRSRQGNDRSSLALGLLVSGRISDLLAEKQQSLSYYQQALELFRALQDRLSEAAALNNLGQIQSDLGNKTIALESFSQALVLTQAIGNRKIEGSVLNNLGAVYQDLGNRQKALEFHGKALVLLRDIGDRQTEAMTLNNIGYVYRSIGDTAKALLFFNQALDILTVHGPRSVEVSTLNNIGSIYSAIGEKQKSLELFTKALALSREIGARSVEAMSLNNIGIIYQDLGELQTALDYLNQALPILRALGNRSIEATTLNNIGGLYFQLKDQQKSLDYFNQALPILRATENQSTEATTLSNIGVIRSARKEYKAALDVLNQALTIVRKLGDRPMEATILNNLGDVTEQLGQTKSVMGFYNASLSLRRAVGDRPGEAVTLYSIATFHRDQNQFIEALNAINGSIALVESMRSSLKEDRLRTSYFATVQDYYALKIYVLMRLHQRDPRKGYDRQALETSDQGRARGLRDLLTEANANLTKTISPSLKSREQALNSQLEAIEQSLIEQSSKNVSDTTIQTLQKELQSLLKQQQSLQAEIRQQNPSYAQIQYPKPIDLPQIQQQLDDNTLLLQYQLGASSSYLWVVSKTGFTSYPLAKRRTIETAVAAFRASLLDPSDDLGLQRDAQSLSQLILTPAAQQLGKRRLLIVSDGVLLQIPFAALAQPISAGSSPPYRPLLESNDISYLPAASLILPQHPNRSPAPKTIAILADPIFNLKDDRLTTKASSAKQLEINETIARNQAARSLTFTRLPGTAIEANSIRGLVPPGESTIVTGFDSTYNWVTTAPLNQYRYLHFATHGIFDQERPELSSLIFSLYNANSQPQRAFLRLPDIFNLNLPTEMITLSACQTGLGDSVPGEGLVGMTRGLMYAGAKRVTVSLWNVPDQETAILMQDFYRSLFEQKGKKIPHSAALRSAQLQLWQQGVHPYYWSGFVMQGEWRS